MSTSNAESGQSGADTGTDDTPKPKALPNVYANACVGNGLFAFGIVVFALFLGSAAFIYSSGKDYPNFSRLVSGFWVISVPVFFSLNTYTFSANMVIRRNSTSLKGSRIWRQKFGLPQF